MILHARAQRQAQARLSPCARRRWLSQSASERLVMGPVQSYISTSRDPFLNLSIEHYLLQKSGPETTILFLYVNRPSVIIGRNQNPWFEVNLALLNNAYEKKSEAPPPGLGVVDLVRRRSGGGTVFHDEGNVNWSVICPPAKFTRDTHAEMVVRALRSCGIDRARVNERHDIVLDQGCRGPATDAEDTHRTPYQSASGTSPRPLKVSGSAYKLTRTRALHHGTCLLSSPNLNIIPDYLHAPGKPFMTARGVESVSSPVGNILLNNADFIRAVQEQFHAKYENAGIREPLQVGNEMLDLEGVKKGYDELRSMEWTYLQTPQFSISSKSEDTKDPDLELSVRFGALNTGSLKASRLQSGEISLPEQSIGHKVHEMKSWDEALDPMLAGLDKSQRQKLTTWLDKMLPSAKVPRQEIR
ncbi:Putative lipoyltransferase/lipoate-protein ligase [Acrodontium crateriforme]|uniref:Putative lipoate-protein ligase A n=1 Tax=Acrodontium crateriforme TaxID=150365 RepID=A0AAQ3LZB7_9PEZI|nr:Putative lipoyltransferase/lipoate-protein ligase [Acrodontium crateriforme]